jgi:hypothetical protein
MWAVLSIDTRYENNGPFAVRRLSSNSVLATQYSLLGTLSFAVKRFSQRPLRMFSAFSAVKKLFTGGGTRYSQHAGSTQPPTPKT